MRRFCQQSVRWHQQFCHSLDHGSHQKCLVQFVPFRQYRIRAPIDDTAPLPYKHEIVVREFEQVGPSKNDLVEVTPKKELEEAGKIVRAQIKQLEEELAVLREGPLGPNSELIQSLPADEQVKVLELLKEHGILENVGGEIGDLDELRRMIEEDDEPQNPDDVKLVPEVTLRIPLMQKVYVKQFNKSLQAYAQDELDENRNLVLWKWYLRCQKQVPGFSNLLPADVWRLLWKSQSDTPSGSKHITLLAKDMLSIQIPLSPSEWVEFLENLLLTKDTTTAVAYWEEKKSELGPIPEIASSFWSIGVHIYAELGKPAKAQEIAFDCLDYGSFAEPQILIPVITAWAESQQSDAQQKTWACYLRLKSELGSQMSSKEYDIVSTTLLKAGKPDLALAVFKDMILGQEKSSEDSNAVYQQALDYISDLQSREISEENINRISLAALLVLPKSFQNKFFYGSWIKKLIGCGEIDAAASVVELMYERGVKPDTKHLNGIIGAWLRKGSPTAKDKAETMAWAMINQRIAFVAKRAGQTKLPSPNEASNSTPVQRIPAFLKRAAPPANIETFSILLLHYTRRSQEQLAEHLTFTMTGPAQISPNSYIMNHWLYAALRKGDLQGVWDKYKALTETVRPDLETFACLWDAAKIQYDRTRIAHGPEFPTVRQLYATMSEWLSGLPARDLRKARDEFSPELYNQIIRCFCLSLDLQGTLAVLYGLRDLFGEYPNADTTQMIVFQISRLLPRGPEQRTGRRVMRRKTPRSEDAFGKVTAILERLADKKNEELVFQDINPDTMTEEAVSETQLQILSEFIILILNQTTPPASVENDIRIAAEEMGVDIGKLNFTVVNVEK